ncbi:cytochrome b/b6 domain-containing protein [Duganella sp. HH101]|uniref:cytochrome b/b6 domain-containing protein n=1 Tax=Duganella sp. HH101 TaxID=1781066 RepID=UPI00087419F0|nr:cytochrome b/b6 domain-containing protein [Duganella sp. HH101]OFA03219.1 putative Ni/Fe-hydrogenase B-type cytochrome subunit [Duganella sp. HH101]
MNQRATYEELQPAAAAVPTRRRILVWDLPTRVFHWSLVLAVTVAIVSGEIGGDWMEVHGKAGLAILGLVAFRLAWGFAGSTHARFLNFLPTASSLRAYLRGRWKGQGHNPLGALSVFALLGLLAVQATTGLFGNDEISFTGPLFALVEEGLANRLTGLHKQLAYVLLAVMALHIVAILVYLFLKKDNLVKPMVTGWKEVRTGTSAAKGSWTALLLSVAFAAAVVACADGAVRW